MKLIKDILAVNSPMWSFKQPLLLPWRRESLTKRALREAPGSPREAGSRSSARDRSQGLLGEDPRSKGTNGASNGGHYGVYKEGIEERERREWGERRV